MKLALPHKLKSFKFSKTWIVLAIALTVGLLAALVARSYLADQMAAIEARAKSGLVEVLVARRELQSGEKLSTDNVAVRRVPEEYVPSGALRPGDFDSVEGRVVASRVKPGDTLLPALLQGKKPPTFSAHVGLGRRAITVAVDEINSLSGMLEPGDKVDLIVTLEHNSKKLSVPLLQSVNVLATGSRAVDDPKSGERRQYTTVTLDTTPEQAQNVVAAREAGKITAMLRNPADKTPLPDSDVDLAALLGLKHGRGADPVPVLYGGRSAKIPPDALVLERFARRSRPGLVSVLQDAPELTPPANEAKQPSTRPDPS